jgi:ribosomal-protein-alanine N-acetyltransferase
MDARYRLRPPTPADAAPLARIERAAFTDPWSEASLRDALSSITGFGIVAETGDAQPVGYILCRAVAGEGEVLNLAVDPAHRRRGLARALLEAALARFRAGRVGRVYLEVRESNAAAIALYRSAGFLVQGRRERYYHRPEEAALVLSRAENGPA